MAASESIVTSRTAIEGAWDLRAKRGQTLIGWTRMTKRSERTR